MLSGKLDLSPIDPTQVIKPVIPDPVHIHSFSFNKPHEDKPSYRSQIKSLVGEMNLICVISSILGILIEEDTVDVIANDLMIIIQFVFSEEEKSLTLV